MMNEGSKVLIIVDEIYMVPTSVRMFLDHCKIQSGLVKSKNADSILSAFNQKQTFVKFLLPFEAKNNDKLFYRISFY